MESLCLGDLWHISSISSAALKTQPTYVGSTQDLTERLERHNQGRSKYTKGKRPWELVHQETFPDRSSATRRERAIKFRKDKGFIESPVGGSGHM
ncbi:MAG: GIY-YIG nuclease family protein [Deltaproteobacteria bacterium]|nr:GIY-YIG nuclease family protein [Deltaproteobacteria bacterium]